MMSERYVVVALFEPIAVGTTFSRRAWPAHVTLVSNFVTTASVADLVEVLPRVEKATSDLRVEFGGLDRFGPHRDVPVRLVLPNVAEELHRSMVDVVESLPGVAADDPEYWRDGYRPHLTLTPSVEAGEGEMWTVSAIAVVRLAADAATVVGSLSSRGL